MRTIEKKINILKFQKTHFAFHKTSRSIFLNHSVLKKIESMLKKATYLSSNDNILNVLITTKVQTCYVKSSIKKDNAYYFV